MADEASRFHQDYQKRIIELNVCLERYFGSEFDKKNEYTLAVYLHRFLDPRFVLQKGERDYPKLKDTAEKLTKAVSFLGKVRSELEELAPPMDLGIWTQLSFSLDDLSGMHSELKSAVARYNLSIMGKEDRNERAYQTAKALRAAFICYSGREITVGEDSEGNPTGLFCKALAEIFGIVGMDFGFYGPAQEASREEDIDYYVDAINQARDFNLSHLLDTTNGAED